MQSGRLLRMRADAAGLLDDFSHQVRTRYPHPVAYRWSRAQVLLSNGADGSANYAILETAEVLLCYCALEVEDLPAAIADAHADLTTLLQRASFLADLPLVHVNRIHWDSLRKVARVEFEELTGDNVLVPVRERTYGSSDLEAGSLYLATDDGRLHLLRPFLIRQRCAKCRGWETLHIDNLPHIATVQIKSLERGHTIQDPQLWDAFEHVGLVERPGS
ncbi:MULTISPECIES: hypothetical protein [Micromonospora]|uniref:hypothetical protein n=1 Tax=Micromonospora TaxID=1873 RepID=UPI001EE81F71|nr:hypothetical protein [Micromonospora hortensis]MCG5452944.1 hypothetical protein [Micromonospora hortensis]WTI10631.1 hypothetical protein OHB44_13560 [Micromonospora sp. NBC_00821]